MKRARRWLLPALLLAATTATASPREDGDAAWVRGDQPAALVAWSQALEAARMRGETDAERDLLIRLAGAHRELGRVHLANQVLDLAERLADEDSARADVALARGLLARHLGDLDAAQTTFDQAYRGYRSAQDPQGAANAAVNLGLARLTLGQTDAARKALDAAGSLYNALGDLRGQADVMVDLALVDRQQGDLEVAWRRLEQARHAFHRLDDPTGVADTLTVRALVELARGQIAAAREDLGIALETAQDRKDVARQATLHGLLGQLSWRDGDAEAAHRSLQLCAQAWRSLERPREALQAALADAQVVPPAAGTRQRLLQQAQDLGDPRLEATARIGVALASLREDPVAAGEQARRAERLARRLELPDVLWQALYVSGQAQRRSGDLEGARAALAEATDLLDRRRRLLPPERTDAYATAWGAVYAALADVLLAMNRPMDALVAAQRLQLADQPLGGQAASAALKDLASREDWIQGLLSEEVGDRGDTERAARLRDELATLRVAFATEVDQLRATTTDFAERVDIHPEDLEALQAELPADVAVLQPIQLPDRLVLLVFRRDSLQHLDVDVDEATVLATTSRLTRALRAGLRDRAVLDPLSERLGGWLWAPAAKALEGARVVLVSATGPFRGVPMALLRHGDRYFIQDHALASLSHVGTLRGGASPLSLGSSQVLWVGDPDGSLAGAQAEVRDLASRVPGSMVLIGDNATRAAVLDGVEGRSVLHLATHGRIDPIQPDRSYLVLAGEGADAQLGYRDIPGLAPWLAGARMVVLSACESGRPVDGPQGEQVVRIAGLAAQFRRAGVETLVASLWKVDDDGTRALMQGFYAGLLQGQDIATAMQQAQIALLDDATNGTPWVWAAFVVAGDWRP